MVHIDMTRPDRDLTAGVDLWEITSCQSAKSRGGNNMLALELVRVSERNERMRDFIVLEGDGWFYGKQKLGALLSADYVGDVDPIGLVGTQLWACTEVKEYENPDTGKVSTSLNVDVTELKHAGYQRADDVPPGCEAPAEDPETEPF